MRGVLRLLLPALLPLAPLPAAAECTLANVATLPLTQTDQHIYVPISMNGTPALFMLDTGSERTILTGAYAARAHVGLDMHAPRIVYSGVGDRQTLPVNQAHVRITNVGELGFQDWEYVVLPPEAGGLGQTERDGILGMDFLHFFDIDIDFHANTVKLWRLSGCSDIHPEWKGDYDAIPIQHNAHQSVTMPIMVDNSFFDVVFDTGSPALVLSHDAGLSAGVTDAQLAADREAGGHGFGGHFPAVVHRFKLLAVGSGQFTNPDIIVETESHRTGYGEGLLGLRYLRPHKVWVSYATNTLFVQPEGK